MATDDDGDDQDIRLATAGAMTPEVFADHVLGVQVRHGVGRILMLKHRPVPAFIDGEIGISDTPAEACVLMMPESGLRELYEDLRELFDDGDEVNDSD